MCCWGKLQTSLSSIPGPLYHRSPSLSSSPEDFRSPFSRGTLLLPTQFRSSQHPEAKEDDPPLTSSSRSGNQNKPGGRGGGYLAGKHSRDSPDTGGAGVREFTPCSLDSPQNSFNLGWGARDWNNRQENNA